MNNIEFKDFIQLQRGFDLPEQNRKAGNVPIVAATSIIGYHNEVKVKAPGVVTGRSGALGEVQFINEDFWPLNTTLWVKDFKGNDPKYVYYFLKTIDFKRFNSGAGVPTLNRNDLDTLEIQIHPYEIQQKIAKILSNYDDLIDNNNKRIKILEEMAQKIYKEWFVDFKYPGHETATFKDTELGKIPKGWEVTKIGSEFETVLGGTPSRNNLEYWGGKIPWLSSGKTNELRIITESEFITELGLKKSSTKLMPKYTTLLAITGATLGQVSMIGAEMCANQSVVGIINNKYQEFIFYMVKNNISNLISKAGGAAQQHINKDIVNDMPFVMPKNSVLENFETIVKPINDEIFTLLYKNKTLQKIRDSLLPRLMSGEIDVEDLEIS